MSRAVIGINTPEIPKEEIFASKNSMGKSLKYAEAIKNNPTRILMSKAIIFIQINVKKNRPRMRAVFMVM